MSVNFVLMEVINVVEVSPPSDKCGKGSHHLALPPNANENLSPLVSKLPEIVLMKQFDLLCSINLPSSWKWELW